MLHCDLGCDAPVWAWRDIQSMLKSVLSPTDAALALLRPRLFQYDVSVPQTNLDQIPNIICERVHFPVWKS